MCLLLQCKFISGLGFRAGSYKCVCKPGYYFPNATAGVDYFNGSQVEAAAADQRNIYYSDPDSFQCLRCQPGCDACVDDSPCIVTLSWALRRALMGLTVVTIIAAFGIMAFVVYFRELKVSKLSLVGTVFNTSSPRTSFVRWTDQWLTLARVANVSTSRKTWEHQASNSNLLETCHAQSSGVAYSVKQRTGHSERFRKEKLDNRMLERQTRDYRLPSGCQCSLFSVYLPDCLRNCLSTIKLYIHQRTHNLLSTTK